MNSIPTTNATPESVWAILQETAQMQKVFAAEYEARQKEYEAQRKKEAAEYEARQKEYETQRKKDAAEYEAQRKKEAAEYEAQRQKVAAEDAARKKALDEYMQCTSEEIRALNKTVNGIAHNNGFLAEEYFQNAIGDSLMFANIKYDFMLRNKHFRNKQAENEFDILLFNGSSVAIIETKYRVHQNDLEPLTIKKVQDFRTFFPMYAQHKIYLGIASMSFNDEVIREAKELGIGILRQKGDTIECDTDNIKVY